MTSTISSDDHDYDLCEILDSEEKIDIDRLRELARQGVPDALRPTVWKYLLGVSILDKSEEVTHTKWQTEMYAACIKGSPDPRMREALEYCKRAYPELYCDKKMRGKIERVLFQFLTPLTITAPLFIHAALDLLRPFTIYAREEDMYYCFAAFMRLHMERGYFSVESLRQTMATFLMLFRQTLPTLAFKLDEEGIPPNKWLLEWMLVLLSKQLHTENLLRLWDTYLASPDNGLSLHVYVCLALLHLHCEKLMVMHSSDLLSFLCKMPLNINMERLITLAFNIREDVRSRNFL